MTGSILQRFHGSGAQIAILAVGLAMIASGAGLLCRQVSRSRYLRETKGNVAGWRREYDALISFRVEDGSQHDLVTTVLASAKPSLKIGNPFPVPVIYDTRHPEDAFIGRLAFGWIVPLVWVALGCGTLMLTPGGMSAVADEARRRVSGIDLPEALAAVGLITTVTGMGTLIRRIVFLRRSDKTVGKLIGWKKEQKFNPRGRFTTYYRAIVSFDASDGSTHEVIHNWGGAKTSATAIGRPYPVRYDPHDPADAYIATAANLWGMPAILLLIGGFLLSVAF